MTYPTKKLREICDVFADGDWVETKDQSSSGIRLIQTGNVGAGVFIGKENSRARFISEATFKRLGCAEVFPGDILISRLPDPVGRACVVPKLDSRMITAVDCTIVRPNITEALPDFLLLYLNSASYFEQVESLLTGTTRKRISRSNLGKIEIPLPTVEEQRRVVAKIEKHFAKIDETARLRAESEELAGQLFPAALHEVFSTAESKRWDGVSIGDKKVMQMTSGGTPSRSNSRFYGGKIAWLKSGELNDNVQIGDSEEHITDEALQKSSAKVFPVGTVLLAMYGATAGKLGILAKPAATNQAVAGIVPNTSRLDSKFLFYCLMQIRKQIIDQAWGGAQPNLSQTILKGFKIPVPPLVEQRAIVKKLDELAEKVAKLRDLQASQAIDFKALKQSVLHEAFNQATSSRAEPVDIKKSIPSPFYRNQVNAAIIEQVVKDGGETTEVAVAKYNHMLQELCGVPLAYQFQEAQYGPFDGQIKRLLYSGLGKNDWFKKSRGMIIPGQKMRALVIKQSNLYRMAQAGMQKLSELGITKMDAVSVELLSTVCHSIRQTKSTDIGKIRAFMSTWQTDKNRTKAEKFSEERTQKCLDFVLRKDLHRNLVASS